MVLDLTDQQLDWLQTGGLLATGTLLAFEPEMRQAMPWLRQDMLPGENFDATPQGALGLAAMGLGAMELFDAADRL